VESNHRDRCIRTVGFRYITERVTVLLLISLQVVVTNSNLIGDATLTLSKVGQVVLEPTSSSLQLDAKPSQLPAPVPAG
jgi:hypothetical protein